MTRQDYELLARAILTSAEELGELPSSDICIVTVAHQLAATLKSDNERFDSERFLRACGVR